MFTHIAFVFILFILFILHSKVNYLFLHFVQ